MSFQLLNMRTFMCQSPKNIQKFYHSPQTVLKNLQILYLQKVVEYYCEFMFIVNSIISIMDCEQLYH